MSQTDLNDLLCKQTHYGVIEIAGQEAVKFLDGQLTCKITHLKPYDSTYGAFCNKEGRLQAFLRLFCDKNRYLLRLPKSMIPNTLKLLEYYGQFSDICFSEKSLDFAHFGVLSDQKILKSFQADSPFYFHPPGKNRIEFLVDQKNQAFCFNLEKQFNSIAHTVWEIFEIQAKIPEIYPRTIETFLPGHLGLIELNAVSLEKGCYRGQEIIVRMAHRGKTKKTLSVKTFQPNTLLLPGNKIDNQTIVRASGSTALLEVQNAYAEKESPLESKKHP